MVKSSCEDYKGTINLHGLETKMNKKIVTIFHKIFAIVLKFWGGILQN